MFQDCSAQYKKRRVCETGSQADFDKAKDVVEMVRSIYFNRYPLLLECMMKVAV